MTTRTEQNDSRLKALVRSLYTSHTRQASRFRYGLILFDGLTIMFFIITAAFPTTPLIYGISQVIGVLIALDLAARFWVAEDRAEMLSRIYTIADIIVIASLWMDPFVTTNVAFLRILRGLRLIHSYHLLWDLRQDSRFFRAHEDAVIAAITLFVFIFATTSAVFALFFDQAGGPLSYIDALYFTVATLTTTGYGDITPETAGFKVFTVFVMVVGVALFVQLARAIFQPTKVRHECEACGLIRHDADAIHCKHCGEKMRIKTVGSG